MGKNSRKKLKIKNGSRRKNWRKVKIGIRKIGKKPKIEEKRLLKKIGK